MAEMQSTGESFFDLALRMSGLHKNYFLDLYTPNRGRLEELAAEADESLHQQRRMESADKEPFEAYLARYFED